MDYSFVEDSDSTTLQIFGEIKEKSQFPDVREKMQAGKTLYIDLSGVSSINSLGIKLWNEWVGSISCVDQIVFRDVPPCIILQMDMVDQFLPKGARISSFMVPYYCGTCDREFNVLFENQKDVAVEEGQVVIKRDVQSLCETGRCDVSEDIHTKKYFRFLLK